MRRRSSIIHLMQNPQLGDITAFIEAFKKRKLALIQDDSSELHRAVLVMPAAQAEPGEVNDIISLTKGILFVAVSSARARSFLLPSMKRPQTLPSGEVADAPDMCVSVEAREGVTTGISASDRAKTISILGESTPQPRKLVKPGHIFPIEAKDGGVLVKASLPEASLDLVTISGFSDAAVFVDVLDARGAFLPLEGQAALCKKTGIASITLSQLVRYRLQTEKLVTKVAEAKIPSRLAGELRSYIYKSSIHGGEHLALIKGEITPGEPVLTRVQPENTFTDVFGGGVSSSRTQLHNSLRAIGERGKGVLVYLRRPDAHVLEKQVASPSPSGKQQAGALMREYGLGAQILRDLGVSKIELLTGSKKNLVGLETFGIEIVSQLPIPL